MPKASLDLKNPGALENVIIRQAEKLGVGIYPNDALNIEDIIYKLAAEVKHSRAMGNKLYTNILVGRLGLIMDYGKFDQRFPVDSTHQIILGDEIERLHSVIRDSKRVIIAGNPGSGKSWLVDEYIDKLKSEDSKVIHYNCFQSLQDSHSLERIRVASLYGNLVSQIVEQCPELVVHKNTIFGADKAELENLLCFIDEEFYLVVDGLDHISREYELHKDLISRSETGIISELLEIHFPDNCYVIISSQPIDEMEEFKGKNYSVFEIEPWGIEQTKSLMATFQINDDTIEDDDISSISACLLKKSQGNALYLSYILRQLRSVDVNKELIDEIPDYDINLSKYYSYLYTKVRNNRTVNALCGADFYLSLDDLMEITGDGEFVEQDISVLHPLLIENILSGGFSIYHESFRRFVLASLKDKKVDLERNVYGILADWLQKKPFFEFDKSFYYLTELLYKIKRDVENIELIEKEFVLKSVSAGYSRKRIRMNLNCIIRSAGRTRNLVALVTAGELLAMLDDMNEFESTGEEYFQAICDIKGASKLNQLMQIDGKPTFDMNTGRIACYISSKAGITPWWELYLDTEAKQYEIEELKYYYRYYLDEQGVTNMNFPIIYTMDVEPLDNNVAYQMIMKKYMANERSINREQEMKNENGDYSTNINYERRKQQRDTEEMLDRISSFDERLLYVGITIVVKANSMEELEERTEKIKIIGQTHNMDIVPHSHKQLDALNTSLPTGARFVDTMRTITSEELSIFIPFNVQEINDNQGYCYGFNKVSKNLIIGNRKLLKNGNGMVFGVPGSGKSYNEKSEMGQVLCFSTDDIIVIDPMSEYKDIAAAWGGQYINLSQSAENVYYVNPFHVPDVVPDIDRFVAEKAEFAYAICEQALKPTPLTSRHIAVIDKAVRDMYSEYFKKKNDRRRRRKTRLESPTIRTMRDGIAERSEGNDSAIELVEQLEVFADGTLDIFAREQSISEENRFTVYGFSELGKRMRAMAMLVMIESITAKIKYNQSDGVATWVYVDEMHELWGEEYSLHALEKMWREVRKRGGICTGMSQNLIDAQRNRSTKTMVSNSEFMLLLDQGTMDKEAVEDLFDISAEQLACVNGADPGMGLIRFGDKIVPFDNTMKKDSELYQLFNTNFHEIAGVMR